MRIRDNCVTCDMSMPNRKSIKLPVAFARGIGQLAQQISNWHAVLYTELRTRQKSACMAAAEACLSCKDNHTMAVSRGAKKEYVHGTTSYCCWPTSLPRYMKRSAECLKRAGTGKAESSLYPPPADNSIHERKMVIVIITISSSILRSRNHDRYHANRDHISIV